MDFAEELPPACPPTDASDGALEGIYRLAPEEQPKPEHFISHAAQGRNLPSTLTDLCGWASCSLTTDPESLKKLSKLKHKYAFKMKIPAGSGLSKKSNSHVHFWRSRDFDPVASVISVGEV